MFAEIIIPQKIGGFGNASRDTLTYGIPANLEVQIGQIVEIPIRNRKTKGVIYKIFSEKPTYAVKEIIRIIDNAPHLTPWQLQVIDWISDYYFCPLFKAFKIFLPSSIIKKKTLKFTQNLVEQNANFTPTHQLNQIQQNALQQFWKSKKRINLLHGITGSGKTEIYIHAANKVLTSGSQVIILVPEIALTPQTVNRFKSHFNQNIGIIHSQLTPKEKEQEWLKIHHGETQIVIGSRSALFAPFKKLGLIIMDEEHDSSYKQDQSPRYNTIDVAAKIAELLNIRVLIGSATPSLETYYRAQTGIYELIELGCRARADSGSKLPNMHIVDLREELKKKNFSIFSELLQKHLHEKITKHEQTMLFLNRRGAASAVICRECGYICKCPECNVPMTYHTKLTTENTLFSTQKLICHHCGRIGKIPLSCPNCHSIYIKHIGLGTQKVEDELNKLLPKAIVIRADSDTVNRKNNFEQIYNKFRDHKADILIGTQMIAQGLHIPNVNLVGVVLADAGLTIPNFRASEKVFQLITQVSGRAGRDLNQGDVIIQTYLPGHYAIRCAAAHDYKGFYDQEIKLRKELNYPPFTQLIKITISHQESRKALLQSSKFFATLNQQNDQLNKEQKNLITHYPALIHHYKKKYRWQILLAGDTAHTLLKKQISSYPLTDNNIIIDVDPLSTL